MITRIPLRFLNWAWLLLTVSTAMSLSVFTVFVQQGFLQVTIFTSTTLMASSFSFLLIGLRGRGNEELFSVKSVIWKSSMIGIAIATLVLLAPFFLGFLVFYLDYLCWIVSIGGILFFGIKLLRLNWKGVTKQ